MKYEDKAEQVVKAFCRRIGVDIPEDTRAYTAHMMTALTVMEHKDVDCWCEPSSETLANGSTLFIHNKPH